MGGVASFESSSLNKLAQSLTGYPSAPVRISVIRTFARGNSITGSRCGADSAGVSQSPPRKAFADGFELQDRGFTILSAAREIKI